MAIIEGKIPGAENENAAYPFYPSIRYRKDAWNYIFAGNCVILIASACLFTLDNTLYSIIFQFTATMVLNSFYHYHASP